MLNWIKLNIFLTPEALHCVLEEPSDFGQFNTNEIFIFISEIFIQHLLEKYLSSPTFFYSF